MKIQNNILKVHYLKIGGNTEKKMNILTISRMLS